MPKPIIRIGDQFIGVCNNHSNPRPISGVINNTPQTFVNDEGRLVAVEGASGVANCGHTGFIIAGSALTLANNMKVALLGDSVIGNGITANMVSGSSLTLSD